MSGKLFGTLLAALMLITGCASPVPLAKNYPLTVQHKVRASHHWDVIAADVTDQTLQSLASKDFLQGRPLFVQAPHKGVAFHKAFHDFMITHMVNRGLAVSETSNGAVEVAYETQVVRHASDRPRYVPGVLTTLTGGYMVTRNLVTGTPSAWVAGGIGLGAAAVADVVAGHVAAPTNTELIVTTSVVSDGLFVMRKSDVYYLEDEDIDLFIVQRPIVLRDWKVVGQ